MSGIPRRLAPGRETPGPVPRAVVPASRAGVPGSRAEAPAPAATADRDRGSVLLETAIAIPVLLAVLLAVVWVIGIGATHLRLGDGAREAARAAARGEDDGSVRLAALRSAPDAAVTIARDDGVVEVRLRQRVRPPLPFLHGLGVTVHAEAAAAAEPADPGVVP